MSHTARDLVLLLQPEDVPPPGVWLQNLKCIYVAKVLEPASSLVAGAWAGLYSPGSFSFRGGSPPQVPLGPLEYCLVPLKASSPQILKEPIPTQGWWRLAQFSLANSATRGESTRPPHTSNNPSACRVYSLEPSRARARHWHVQSQSPEPGQSIPLSCFRTG